MNDVINSTQVIREYFLDQMEVVNDPCSEAKEDLIPATRDQEAVFFSFILLVCPSVQVQKASSSWVMLVYVMASSSMYHGLLQNATMMAAFLKIHKLSTN